MIDLTIICTKIDENGSFILHCTVQMGTLLDYYSHLAG